MNKKFFIYIVLFSLAGLLLDILFKVHLFNPIGFLLGAYFGFDKAKQKIILKFEQDENFIVFYISKFFLAIAKIK